MKTRTLLTSYFLLLTSLSAAPAKGPVYETVAEGYCAWAGLTDANFVRGRRLCPSDLRHKLTAVVFVDAADFDKHLRSVGYALGSYNPTTISELSPESLVFDRSAIGLIVFVGKVDREKLTSFIKNTKELAANMFIYANVTGSKVPDNGGKLPFYCVFAPEGGDPIASGEYDAEASKKLVGLRRDKKYRIDNWRPYYGTIEEPQHMKGFVKKLSSGKPLEPLTAECQKGIAAKDPEKAKECQILFDALEQTRSDYLFDVMSFAGVCPTRSFYKAQILLKQWPRSKKTLQPAVDRVKSIPDMPQLCKMYSQLKTWSAEDFTCKNAGEAKKIEAELKKMKATCDALIEKSSVGVVQSAAAWIANEAEMLAPQMAAKVQSK